MSVPRRVAIVGPTASGKTELSLAVAALLEPVEVVSVDSMQVYRGMDIGTAKPSAGQQAMVRHHMIDVLDPWEDCTVAWFQGRARTAMAGIEQRGHHTLLVGGTGLYHRAVVDDLEVPSQYPDVRAVLEADPDTAGLHRRLIDLDPVAAARIDPANRRRIVRALEVCVGSGRRFSLSGPGLEHYPESDTVVVGLALSRERLTHRIRRRVESMIEAGLVDEVRALLAEPRGISRTARQALGYRELLGHIEGDVPLGDAVSETILRTRRFAVRQERWFRRDPRIIWFDAESPNLAARVADTVGAS